MRYIFYGGLSLLCLLLVYCKKDDVMVEDLPIIQKQLQLKVEVLEIDSILMTASIKKEGANDALAKFDFVDGSPRFLVKRTSLPDTIIYATDCSLPNNIDCSETNDSLFFKAILPNAGEDSMYTITALTSVELDKLNTKDSLQSKSWEGLTQDITLETSITIDSNGVFLSTLVLVNGMNKLVQFDEYGHLVKGNSIVKNLDITIPSSKTDTLKADTLFKVLPSNFPTPFDYSSYAIFKGKRINSDSLTISLESCRTETKGVTINFTPPIPSSLTIENINLCGLRLEVPVILSDYKYRWYQGENFIKQTDENSITIGQTDTLACLECKFTVEHVLGDCPSAKSNEVSIMVNNIRQPVIAERTSPVCGNSVTLEVEDYQQYASFQWFKDGKEIEGETSSQLIDSDITERKHEYYVIASSSQCETSISSTIEVVNFILKPIIKSTLNDEQLICKDTVLKLYIENVISYTDESTFVWYRGTSIGTTTEPNFTDELLHSLIPGQYNYTVSVTTNSCSLGSNPIEIDLYDFAPIINFDSTSCLDGFVEIIISDLEVGNNYEYQIRKTNSSELLENMIINSENNDTIIITGIPNPSGPLGETYTLTIKDMVGCKIDTSIIFPYIECAPPGG